MKKWLKNEKLKAALIRIAVILPAAALLLFTCLLSAKNEYGLPEYGPNSDAAIVIIFNSTLAIILALAALIIRHKSWPGFVAPYLVTAVALWKLLSVVLVLLYYVEQFYVR